MNTLEKKKPWQGEEWLKEQYFQKNLTFKQIGKLVNRTDKTIEHFFKKFGLTSRPPAHSRSGSLNYRWIGGKIRDARGYIKIFHLSPHAYKGKKQRYVLEHILIMEKVLGRKLQHPEVIHHKNGIPDDNRPENLQLMANPFEHSTLEQRIGRFAKLILFGDLKPHLRNELQLAFQDFLHSLINER